jgi:Spy/CpxP family protein refolding chaperone
MDAQKQEHKQDRRRFFRRAGVFGLIGAAATGVGWKAYAHGGWRRGEPLTEARVERLLQHFYIEIDATEEQKQRLGPIVREAVRELAPLHQRVHAARAQAIALLSADQIDGAAVEKLRAEQIALAEQASQRLTQALVEAAQVLTPAQRKELAQRFERRRHHWS